MLTTYRCPKHGIVEPVRVRYNMHCPDCLNERPKRKKPTVKWKEIRPGVFVRKEPEESRS